MADAFITNAHRSDFLLVAVALSAVVYYVYGVLSSPLAKIPGPWYSNFTEFVVRWHWLQGQRAKYVHSLHQKYGPVVRVGPDEVDVTDVPSIKAIHTVKATYIKSPKFYKALSAPGVESVFSTTDIYTHRRHRKLLSGGFSESSLKSYLPIVEQRVNLAVKRMSQEMESSRGVADVFKWWLFMATDVIGELTFGESFRMLELGEKNDYSRNLEKIAGVSAKRNTFPWLAKLALKGVPIPGFADNTEVVQKNTKYTIESLQRYQNLVEKNPERPVPTLFTRLFKGEEEDTLTFKEIQDDATAYIVAGSDTTAITLTYLVWRVLQNPEIRDKLVHEVQQLPQNYSDHEVQALPYLNQTIEEALRLHPAASSALPRIVPQEGAEFAGNYLPPGSTVSTQAYSLHRNPSLYPDPEKFDPSRWAAPTKDMKDSMLPFGGGSRICIGMHLARLEMRLATARFFRAFPQAKVSNREGMCDDDMEQTLFFLGPPKGKRCLVECS
ncbi:hypothetical protein N0V93_000441 [Gnomoniopsis smithogilvyi]|uniref:Cytochrome P450 n=1 Tax=Gnomoniopsis smithogilvyi TaxID=1191159 RepID=A0A9W8Z404_9PEZI|nr:hypothetical protein N0V93_000441 [Gnomoniopsis smithogilvyi]